MAIKVLFIFLFFSVFIVHAQNNDSIKNLKNEIIRPNGWSVSTNLTSLIRSKREFFFIDNIAEITSNPYFTIEPELELNKYISVKFPFGFGINRLRNGYEENNRFYSSYSYGFDFSWMPSFLYDSSKEPYFSTYYQAPNYVHGQPLPKSHIRRNDLICQIGVYPKIFPFGHKKVAIYFAPGFNVGLMDKYKIDYYHSFKQGSSGWDFTGEKMIINRNPFFFVRPEVLLGVQITIGKTFSLNFESGIAPLVNSHGKKPDRVFYQFEGSDFKLVYTDNKNSDDIQNKFRGYFINRILIKYTIPRLK